MITGIKSLDVLSSRSETSCLRPLTIMIKEGGYMQNQDNTDLHFPLIQ